MSLSGKVKEKSYLFKLLKEIIKKKMKLEYSHEPITRKMKRNHNEYLIQEKLLVKILNECLGLNVDATLIEMELKKEDLK